MKKTTIALLTAAALGTSGLAAAQTDGPNFSGRVDIRFNDVENDDSANEGTLKGSNASSKLAVFGSSDDAVAGLSTFYYSRLALVEGGGTDVDYALAGFEGDFGRLSFGIDDDLVYKYVGAYTDVYRGVGPTTGGALLYADVGRFGQDASIQYSIDIQNFSVAGYADTANPSDGETISGDDGRNDGINRTQLAGSVDLGVLDLGAAYSDSDIDGADDQIALGGSVDVGIASLRATYLDDADGNNPVHAVAVIPLNDIFTATFGYGALDDDNDSTEVNGMLMADLGGGLDLNLSVRASDEPQFGGNDVETDGSDGVSAGVRYSF